MYQEFAMKKKVSRFWVKKLLALVFLLTFTGMIGLFATPITIRLESPKLGGDNPLKDQIQGIIDTAFAQRMGDFQSAVQGINGNPQSMIGAFATSSVFSSAGASLRTYQGYDAFAFTLGAMGGAQIPGNPFSWVSGLGGELDNAFDVFDRTGDIRVGVNPQILNAQLGINTSKFLLKGLYVGLKGGFFNLNLPFNDYSFSFRTWSIGGLVNYQLIPQIRFPAGVIVWRGVNIGTGFIYQGTNLTIGLPLFPDGGNVTIPINVPGVGNITGEIRNAKFEMVFNVNTLTVPLEAVTSIRLLGFANASIGAGVDFGFGNAGLGGDIDASIIINIPPGYNLHMEKEGSFSVNMGGKNSPSPVSPKIMASIGFSAGPAILLDIPITYYFLSNGYNIGITFGIAL
jgi:hypothetical protein